MTNKNGRRNHMNLCLIASFLAFMFFLEGSAFAYIDPGTGGMLYQIIILVIGAILGYFAIAKNFIRKILGLKKKDPDDLSKKDGN
jgi:hypothetical protein